MRIARIGATYASAYEFSTTLMDDSWSSSRPPVAQKVSGADGVFDYYGELGFPLAPVTATKKFAIVGTSAADLEDSLNTLRLNTITYFKNLQKLWWLDRDETTKYWSWAKTISLNTADSYKDKGRWLKPVTVQFYMPEGVWYAETVSTTTFGPITGPSSGFASTTYIGNYYAAVKATVNASNKVEAVSVQVSMSTGPTFSRTVTFDDTGGAGIAAGEELEIDSASFSALNDAAGTPFDAYDKISLPTGQVTWLYFPPAIQPSALNAFVGASGITSGATLTIDFEWYNTYVF